MKRHSVQRVDDLLRNEAASARRDPSHALRERITAALEAEASRAARTSLRPLQRTSTTRAIDVRAWLRRLHKPGIAASVLIAVALLSVAILYLLPSGEHPAELVDVNARNQIRDPWENGVIAIQGASSPESLTQLAREAPQALRMAIDDSLFAELGKIGEDATQAARFLVGRVPRSFMTGATEDTLR